MKQNKTYIPIGLLLLATLFSAAPIQADDYISCKEYYDYGVVSDALRGTINVTQDGNTWILTAVPTDDSKYMFIEWNDGNTDNPRTITSNDMDSLTETFSAKFDRYIYTNCYSSSEYAVTLGVDVENTYGHIDTATVDGVFQMTAVPESSSYTFAQWADGSYENPRTFVPTGAKEIPYYATFIPKSKVGKVDFWRKDGFVVTTDSPIDLTKRTEFGGITVFYDGQYVSCAQPKAADVKTEPKVDKGVYFIPAEYGSTHALAGKKCHLVYKNASYEPIATLDTIIPFLIDGEETVSADGLGAGVHVLRGGVATFASNQTISDLDIYAGGKAIIESGDTLTVSSVKMRADAVTYYSEGSKSGTWNYPVLYPDFAVRGSLKNNASDVVNYDYSLDWNAFYPFGLPATVNTANVAYSSGNDARDHFVLGNYDGARRAREEATCWVDTFDYATTPAHMDIVPGKGYNIFAEGYTWNGKEQKSAVIRFPMTVNLIKGDTVKSIGVTQYDAAKKENKNWNLIASPYLTEYNGPIYLSKDGEVLTKDDNPIKLRYITIPGDNFMSYHHKYVEDTVLFPFHSYLIQFDTIANELAFANPNPAARAAAPARRAAKVAEVDAYQELKAGVILSQAGQSDNTGLFIGTEYTNDYDINGDLSKMIGSKQGLSVYTMLGSKKLAYNAFPPANGTGMVETTIPLGYCNATAGQDMTFDVDWWHNKHLYADENITEINLIDDVEGVTTNLLEDSYTCTAQKASDNTRFSLGIRYTYKAPQIATDICETPAETTMRDGVYDLLGRLISTDARAARAGVYIVIENGKARKEVVR